MSAATTIAAAFGEGANLYTDVLALPESGPAVPHAKIRRAYYKRCLMYHPDKCDASKLTQDQMQDAKRKFQAISVAYNILSNEENRAEYDENGELYDEDDDQVNTSKSGTDHWAAYFSGIFGNVTVDDIDRFEAQYKCSDEEEKDVLKYYTRFQGDLNKCLECVMCSREEDKKRWVEDYINPAVERGDAEDFRDAINASVGEINGGDEEEEHDDDDDESIEEISPDEVVVMEEEEVEEEDMLDDEATESENNDSDEESSDRGKSRKKNEGKKKQRQGAKAKRKQQIGKKNNRKKPTAKKATKSKVKASTLNGKSSGVSDDLITAIRGNAVARSQQSFESMMAGLEERYGGGCGRGSGKKKRKGGGKKKKQPVDDIPDDEFERIRASLSKKK